MCSICCKDFQGVLVGGACRGCTPCKKCIVSFVGALETSAPPARSAPIVLLVHLRQVHPLERYLHPLVAPPAPEVLKMLIL